MRCDHCGSKLTPFYVYVILARNPVGGDLFKIGYAANVSARLSDMRNRPCAPVPLVKTPELLTKIRCETRKAAMDLERELHRRFAALRIGKYEWFRVRGEADRKLLASIADGTPVDTPAIRQPGSGESR